MAPFSSNQIYIVTGAGRGIGQAIAQGLVERGARVLALDLAFEDSALSSSDLMRTQICDVSSETSVQAAFVRLAQEIAKASSNNDETLTLRGLVNCAGVVLEKSLLDTTVHDIDHVLGVNLRGPILCTQAAVRHVLEKRQETQQSSATPPSTTPPLKIINISSELAHLGRENYSVYCASKGAIMSLTRSWAHELAPHGILVNAVAPGPTDTPMLQSESNYAAWKNTAQGIPLGRIGQPQDIASVVCFLLNPLEANYMTGSVVDVNGGAAMA